MQALKKSRSLHVKICPCRDVKHFPPSPKKEMTTERKTEFIGFRLTARDREAIEKVASGFGLTMSDFLRDFTIRIVQQIKTENNG